MYTCRISVHELVETSYLQGSLTSQGMSAQRAQLGARIRMLQGQRGKNYQSEVFFRHESVLDDITIIVEGRADGIEITDGGILVEEIKSTLLPVEQIDDSIFVHFAQCYVYAHFCLLQHPEQEEIVTRVTYVQAKSGQEKHFERTLSRSELDAFYAQLLDNYRRWAVLRRDLHISARTSTKALQFPFPSYRDHQREFAAWVYQTIINASSLIVQAPTGIGKTISTLFPALKALGEGKCEKIFYLCAKNMTVAVARDTMRLFYAQDLFPEDGLLSQPKTRSVRWRRESAMNARMRTTITGGCALCFTACSQSARNLTPTPFPAMGKRRRFVPSSSRWMLPYTPH